MEKYLCSPKTINSQNESKDVWYVGDTNSQEAENRFYRKDGRE